MSGGGVRSKAGDFLTTTMDVSRKAAGMEKCSSHYGETSSVCNNHAITDFIATVLTTILSTASWLFCIASPLFNL
jgi:hypothetical protein